MRTREIKEALILPWKRNLLIFGFFPILLSTLYFDSLQVGGDQSISNGLAILYYCLMLLLIPRLQKVVALLFLPVAALAEYLFSILIELYIYRLEAVPIYVPFGHAILFITGLLISTAPISKRYEKEIRQGLSYGYLLLFVVVIFVWQDSMSFLLLLLFALIYQWRQQDIFYLIMGVLVIILELVGTRWGAWEWGVRPFELLQTTNPPVGAATFYLIGDLLLMGMTKGVVSLWRQYGDPLWSKRKKVEREWIN